MILLRNSCVSPVSSCRISSACRWSVTRTWTPCWQRRAGSTATSSTSTPPYTSYTREFNLKSALHELYTWVLGHTGMLTDADAGYRIRLFYILYPDGYRIWQKRISSQINKGRNILNVNFSCLIKTKYECVKCKDKFFAKNNVLSIAG